MGVETTHGHCRIMKERKLMSCNNGRGRSTGIMGGGGIRSRSIEVRAVSGQEGFWIEELFNRDS